MAARLVQTTSIEQSDLVIEIGAGRGALTKPLLKQAGRVIAVELDPYLAERLQHQLGQQATIEHTDFLHYQLPGRDYRVVGNIPYARSSEILHKLTSTTLPPLDAWLVVQRELAQRMCGHPYTTESLRSLSLKPFWHVEIRQRLRRDDFVLRRR